MGVNIGIVGVGRFGSHFIPLYRDHPWVDRFALCDLDGQRLKEASAKYDLTECYDSLEAACASDLDGLFIATQPWLHAPQAIQALEAGKHVCSAVPVIMLADGDEMLGWCDKLIEAVQRTGRHYAMNETSYFRPQTMYCRRRAAQGDFGRFVAAHAYYRHDYNAPRSNLLEVDKRRWGKQWDRTKTGKTPMHYCTHSMGGVLGVMPGHATKVAAVGYQHPDDPWFRCDTIYQNPYCNEMALVRLSNGATVYLSEMRRVGDPGEEGFDLYGTEGSFRRDGKVGGTWATVHGEQQLTDPQMRDPLPEEVEQAWGDAGRGPGLADDGHGGSHAYLVHEFVDVVVRDRLPKVNAWQAARYVAPGVMAHKSALRDGQWMDVPDWGDAPAA